MKLNLCLSAIAVLCFAYTNADSLLHLLTQVHASPAFQTLNHSQQILIIELLVEVREGELQAYIDTVGFHNVIAVIDALPASEAHLITHLITQELDKENVNVTHPITIGKRSLTNVLNAAMTDPAYQHLPQVQQDLLQNLLKAAENNTLTDFIDQVGYATILRLVDVLPATEAHQLDAYLIQHLQGEIQHN